MGSSSWQGPSTISAAALMAACAVAIVFVVYGGDPLDFSTADTPEERTLVMSYLLIAVAFALISHALISRWLLACFAAAGLYAVSLQIYGFASTGYLDGWAIIALPISGLIGFAIAASVGIPFLAFRQWRELRRTRS